MKLEFQCPSYRERHTLSAQWLHVAHGDYTGECSQNFHHCAQIYRAVLLQIFTAIFLYSVSFSLPSPSSSFFVNSFKNSDKKVCCHLALKNKTKQKNPLSLAFQLSGNLISFSFPSIARQYISLIPSHSFSSYSPSDKTIPSKMKFIGPFSMFISFTFFSFPKPAGSFFPYSISIILTFSTLLTSIPFLDRAS